MIDPNELDISLQSIDKILERIKLVPVEQLQALSVAGTTPSLEMIERAILRLANRVNEGVEELGKIRKLLEKP